MSDKLLQIFLTAVGIIVAAAGTFIAMHADIAVMQEELRNLDRNATRVELNLREELKEIRLKFEQEHSAIIRLETQTETKR